MVALPAVFKTIGRAGFTLIELSIVLIIIGLVVGGVLVGRDLISAAQVRAQISQIEKYNSAVNTFRGKYGYLPGDIPNPIAGQYGFMPRGNFAGEGDGNGILEGVVANSANENTGFYECAGETVLFWSDLTGAGLVPGKFTSASFGTPPAPGIGFPGITLDQYFPQASIGQGNYIYVWSGGISGGVGGKDESNYFGVSAVFQVISGGFGMISGAGLTVLQAYQIDQKIDDGLPQSGNVTAALIDGLAGGSSWASGGGYVAGPLPGSTTPPSSTSCYDNNNVAGAIERYSVGFDNGMDMNCALSFKFQ